MKRKPSKPSSKRLKVAKAIHRADQAARFGVSEKEAATFWAGEMPSHKGHYLRLADAAIKAGA